MFQRGIWKKINEEIAIWWVGAVPGLVVTGLVMIARLTGSLQFLEWITLDNFLRLRPDEPVDERIVIIGINEADIRAIGTYPIPDREIARLLETLQSYEPRAICLDIVRDIPVQPGHAELVAAFKGIKNLIAIEKVLPDSIAPPPALSAEQVGFSDVIPDADGHVRRNLLGTPTPQGYKFSLSIRLAKTYLAREGITLDNGIHDTQAMRFGLTELPRFLPNSGGYVGTDAGGVQVLLNFRTGQERFRTLSLNDIKTGNFNPNWIRDRIVLVGIIAPSVKDTVNTSAIAGLKPSGLLYGIEFQAHAVSQIISATLDGRPLLKVWSDGWEYFWILGWGILAIVLGRLTQSALINLFYIGVVSIGLVGVGYVFLFWGWWIPVAPALLVLIFNGLGLSAFAFYQYDRALRLQIYIRQHTIEQTFKVIHNGPLQTLAYLIRRTEDQDLPQEQLLSMLKSVNQEIREVSEYMKSEVITQKARLRLEREVIIQEAHLRLGSGSILDLKRPIHELLEEVYRETIKRDLSEFKTLKVKAIKFAPIEERYLSFEQKREFCQFLEEAVCNVGKHAQGVTRITITGKQNDGWYTLSVQDNGLGIRSSLEGRGTKQFRDLAKQMGGEFKRESISPRGTLCELTWPLEDRSWRFARIGYRMKIMIMKWLKF